MPAWMCTRGLAGNRPVGCTLSLNSVRMSVCMSICDRVVMVMIAWLLHLLACELLLLANRQGQGQGRCCVVHQHLAPDCAEF